MDENKVSELAEEIVDVLNERACDYIDGYELSLNGNEVIVDSIVFQNNLLEHVIRGVINDTLGLE
jgi:hypothetical protein